MAANLLDYYLNFIGANNQPGYTAKGATVFNAQTAPSQQIQADLTTPTMDDWRAHAANPAAVNAASEAVSARNPSASTSPTSGMNSQLGNSGMTKGQFGGVIANAIQGATKNLASTPNVSIPRGTPIETANFRFPTISYQQQRA